MLSIFQKFETIDSHTLRIDAEAPRLGDIKQAIKHIKANKVPGPDNITAEMIKVNTTTIAHLLHLLLTELWESERILEC